ncbi:carbohydrate kinase family protein [Candidatus Foliamicus sp.]
MAGAARQRGARTTIIGGSLAYDHIMVFQGRFGDHILPDKVHVLNVAFEVPEFRREFGGCAANIAYNLALLGDCPLMLASAGRDFAAYRSRIEQLGLDMSLISELPDQLTAQAYIITDLDDNQITAFHPGAMEYAHRRRLPDDTGATLGLISPDGRQAMLEHAAQMHDAGLPFVFDPGQSLPIFSGAELRNFVRMANWVAANSYEAEVLLRKTGWDRAALCSEVQAFIVTEGAAGARIYHAGTCENIPAARVRKVADPTGCGDAFRAGLAYGIARKWNWGDTGRLAALLGAIKAERAGTQNHRFDRALLQAKFKENYGYEIDLGNSFDAGLPEPAGAG